MARSKLRPEHEIATPPPTRTVRLHGSTEDVPSLAEYIEGAEALARVVRDALDRTGHVTRGDVRKVLVRFEQTIEATKGDGSAPVDV